MDIDKAILTNAEIWEATRYEPNNKEPLTLQDGRRVAKAQHAKSLTAFRTMVVEEENPYGNDDYCYYGFEASHPKGVGGKRR